MCEEYNGWTNRETWAVKLYIDNDQGWQESALADLRDFVGDNPNPDDESVGVTAYMAGTIIRENVERVMTVAGYAEMTGEDHLPGHLSSIAEDIGSLYRVDWSQIGASFLDDLAEESE